ncbi:MAG: hypothetical protein COS76_04400 [Candidatus Portnoybacteria bacterium CG06_land_8_20_14_3_00_39_12]|uniref:Uncharacterized protein n=2 Tax=Parcubacteria group TaxID=1794811 RepID=A0A2M7AVW5_9BACT|nr:MAG: hypothetical protein COS76_04400 [Candidatus Portnoybacteria bacterium CG06_land_8_20_14_3_00_39_12]PIZ88620.1 MAG: hypothetical protein COX90_03615 [Candidatus Nealsonbacteria bacterium CG_4_10_14_0_2_um_filter_38_17]
MAEIPNPEIIREQAALLLKRWQTEALPAEKTEHLIQAVKVITDASQDNTAIPIISPICANYETLRIGGKRRPTIHSDLVWNWTGHSLSLRKGYLLCHEEIPHRLSKLQKISGQTVNYLVVLVDYGMAETLFGPLNPDYYRLPQNKSIQQHIDETLENNVATIQTLINHGLANEQVKVTVAKLSQLVSGTNFESDWSNWNQKLRSLLKTPNNHWGGLIRREIKKERRYYEYAWGLTTEEQLFQRVIDQQYGLVAIFADWLHQFHNSVYSQGLKDKGSLLLLDTIPGPDNPAHSEFQAYNLDYPDGTERVKTPILRPFHNLVLLSDPAVSAPYLNKSLEQIMAEVNEFC